ncbi:hypothetical protein CBD41_01410 [bacterium TMED181]|nr:hypothetical protein [Planctomycetota bacterium]OUW47182.1 MAG: hypothetical protein CBD41_01410 [bacterium TMED181]
MRGWDQTEEIVTEISNETTPEEPSAGNRATYARLRDQEQRVAGGGRWSVDSSRRFCALTKQEIPRGTPFWTVLATADPDSAPESAGPLAAFFSRQDYCDEAMAGLDPGSFFARWRTVIPEESGPVKRVVNLASLLATFLELAEPIRKQEPAEAEESAQAADADPGADAGEEGESDPSSALRRVGLEIDSSTDRSRLAYLLALFLIRKRALIWDDHVDSCLRVREKSSEEIYEIPAPEMDRETLEAAVSEIESLFS